MTEAEWLTCDVPFNLMECLHDKGSDRKHLLAAIHAFRGALTSFPLPVLLTALTICERQAEGRASCNEMYRLLHVFVKRSETLNPDPADPANPEKQSAAGNVVSLVDAMLTATRVREAVKPAVSGRDAGQACVIRDIFGNPFRPVAFSPLWRTGTAVALARQMYDSREFSTMPILADALQDAGCDNDDILAHCRDTSLGHVRGCWVTDLVLEKQ